MDLSDIYTYTCYGIAAWSCNSIWLYVKIQTARVCNKSICLDNTRSSAYASDIRCVLRSRAFVRASRT